MPVKDPAATRTSPSPRTSVSPKLLTIASAALIVFSFPPWGVYPLIWLCLVPWFMALSRCRSAREAFFQGVWLSFFMTVGGFSWVAFVLKEFGGIPSWLAVVGLLLFALISQIQFLVFAPIFWKATRRAATKAGAAPGARAARWLALGLGLALLYSGIDWILPKLWVDTLGHAFFSARHLRQLADLGGAALLTCLVYGVNDCLWRWSELGIRACRLRSAAEAGDGAARPSARELVPLTAFVVGLVVSGYAYGRIRYEEIVRMESSSSGRKLQAAVIQANIGDFDKIASERGVRGAANQILDTFFHLSERALAQDPKPDVLVWPETSYPSTFGTPATTDERIRDQSVDKFVARTGVPLLFGGYDHFKDKDYNAFFFLAPRRPVAGQPESPELTLDRDLQVYRKNILLLFGEYIPGAEEIKFLRDQFPQVGNFGRGVGPEVLAFPLGDGVVKAGPIICYEALFPNYVIDAARKGSQLILNITNDSWFGSFGEPQLHLALTAFRSIETRLPQLRATNTGISALILPDGEITHPTAIGAEEILNVTIPLHDPEPTLMVRWRDWFGPAAAMAGALLLVVLALI